MKCAGFCVMKTDRSFMKQKRKRAWFPATVMMLFAFCACGSSDAAPETAATAAVTAGASESAAEANTVKSASGDKGTEDAFSGEQTGEEVLTTDESQEDVMLQLTIGQEEVTVAWEDNESVDALKELAQSGPLTIHMSMYGGFEQVGSLGRSLPRNDVQTTTQAGDIVLYSGNQIVMFYGSNSWAYTRLGHITDQTASELTELLGSGDVTITIGTE